MKNIWKLIIVVILACTVFAVLVLKNKEKQQTKSVSVTAPVIQPVAAETNVPAELKKLPKLIDLGADKCVPCKMMAPVLEQLAAEYKGKLDVTFYDVWKNSSYADKYGVEIIPTQIFFDPNEKELFRHQGFFSKDEILAKWKELGFEIK
jgi:thioredoxin 1